MAKTTSQQEFGGNWTQQKLELLQKYLSAYTRIFDRNERARFFRTTYVDAFAGTGYMQIAERDPGLFNENLHDLDTYQKGSVIRALEVQPGFDQYLFIEKSPSRCEELNAIKKIHPAKKIEIKQADANSFLTNWCRETDWMTNRAVVFLDPFGTSVQWQTIESIAQTRAIDLWILFPLFAVNRMLVRSRKPPAGWARRLTQLLGTDEWAARFYTDPPPALFDLYGDAGEPQDKVANYQKIGEFFVDRLKTTFVAAAEPLVLRNSRNSPLYLLCFAAGNKAGAGAGMNIAKSIIGRK